MWTNRPSFFLLLKVRYGMVHFILPIPLFVIEDLLSGIQDFTLVSRTIFPKHTLPAYVSCLSLETFQQLRLLGRWQALKLQQEKCEICISFV